MYFTTVRNLKKKIEVDYAQDCSEFSARTTLSVLLTAQKQAPLSVSPSPPFG